MCTVSWITCAGGYDLFSNRDERLTRAPASGPELHQTDGVRFLAPIDREFGGTWIGANEYGLCLCLLNGEQRLLSSPAAPKDMISRGLFLRTLLSARTVLDAAERFSLAELNPFAPFSVVAIASDQAVKLLEWNGHERSIFRQVEAPLISSSVDSAGVRAARYHEFDRLTASAGRTDLSTLAAFHSGHAHGRSAYSTCMHRPDAETVSFSHVRVREGCIDFFYSPQPPCRSTGLIRRFLPLRRAIPQAVPAVPLRSAA